MLSRAIWALFLSILIKNWIKNKVDPILGGGGDTRLFEILNVTSQIVLFLSVYAIDDCIHRHILTQRVEKKVIFEFITAIDWQEFITNIY